MHEVHALQSPLEVGITLTAMASVRIRQGTADQLNEAITWLGEALENLEPTLGSEKDEVGIVWRNKGDAFGKRGDVAKAREAYTRAVAIFTQTESPHLQVAEQALRDLG